MKIKPCIREAKQLGKKIKLARLILDLTQKQLASKVNLKEQHTISCYEAGKSTPSLKTFIKIIKALKKPSSFFIDDLIYHKPQKIKFNQKHLDIFMEISALQETMGMVIIKTFSQLKNICKYKVAGSLPCTNMHHKSCYIKNKACRQENCSIWNRFKKQNDDLILRKEVQGATVI